MNKKKLFRALIVHHSVTETQRMNIAEKVLKRHSKFSYKIG